MENIDKKQNKFVAFCEKNKIVLVWGLISIVVAVAIHFVFYFPAKYEWLVHQWEAGDILTYISTVALGLLAIWQNQKFKEESDKAQAILDQQNADAQDRIERIYTEANELNVVARIVDFETQFLMRLEKAGLDVLNCCQTYTLLDAMIKADKEKNCDPVSVAFSMHIQTYSTLLTTFFSGMKVSGIDLTPTIRAFQELDSLTCNVIKNYLESKQLDTSFADAHLEAYKKAINEINHFLHERRQLLQRVLTGSMSAKDIKLIYSGHEES